MFGRVLFSVVCPFRCSPLPLAVTVTSNPILRAASLKKSLRTCRQVTIHHQDIPGYMMEMTMDFHVKYTNEFNGISVE